MPPVSHLIHLKWVMPLPIYIHKHICKPKLNKNSFSVLACIRVGGQARMSLRSKRKKLIKHYGLETNYF